MSAKKRKIVSFVPFPVPFQKYRTIYEEIRLTEKMRKTLYFSVFSIYDDIGQNQCNIIKR